jgi:hypothetical protein
MTFIKKYKYSFLSLLFAILLVASYIWAITADPSAYPGVGSFRWILYINIIWISWVLIIATIFFGVIGNIKKESKWLNLATIGIAIAFALIQIAYLLLTYAACSNGPC